MNKTSASMIVTVSIMLSGCGALSQSNASPKNLGNGWCHEEFKATDGTIVKIAYQHTRAYGRSGVSDISPFWINVERQNIGHANVRGVLLQEKSNYSTQFDLQPAGRNRSTGQNIGHVVSSSSQPSSFEVAIVVNGVWLQDPVSGTHNFGFTVKYSDQCIGH